MEDSALSSPVAIQPVSSFSDKYKDNETNADKKPGKLPVAEEEKIEQPLPPKAEVIKKYI